MVLCAVRCDGFSLFLFSQYQLVCSSWLINSQFSVLYSGTRFLVLVYIVTAVDSNGCQDLKLFSVVFCIFSKYNIMKRNCMKQFGCALNLNRKSYEWIQRMEKRCISCYFAKFVCNFVIFFKRLNKRLHLNWIIL